MQKIYLILRNNKQSGPFTLEELVALSLKPQDLIWVEGRSAGWRYPTEIDALKPYVQTPNKEITPSASPAESGANRTNTREGKEAPRTGHIYISIPGGSEKPVMKKETPPAPSVPEEESGLTEEALERKARELYQRVQAYAEKKEQGSPDGVETKYAKSLEDLKQEYSDWMHKKKRSGNRRPIVINKKAIGLTAMVAVVFLAGFIFAQWLNRDSIKVQPISDNKVMSLQSDKNSVASQKKVNPPVTDPGSAGDINDEPGITEQALYDQPVGKEPKGNGPAPASKASIQKNKNNQQQSGQQEVSSLIEKYTGKAVTTTSNATEQPAEPPKAKLPLSQLVSMNGRYMKDNEKKNITGLEITVMNNSDEVVRSVAVKVSYHKKGGREFDTETVYVNNIHPHTPFTISRPGNKKAHSATFQIIQIQGE